MKSVISIIAITGLLGLAYGAPYNETGLDKRCCNDGCYSVKIETHVAHDCSDAAYGASIANYGSDGPCVDTYNGHNYLLPWNDGCSSSNPDLHCYDNLEDCNADANGSGGALTVTNPGTCFIAPPDCYWLRAVSN